MTGSPMAASSSWTSRATGSPSTRATTASLPSPSRRRPTRRWRWRGNILRNGFPARMRLFEDRQEFSRKGQAQRRRVCLHQATERLYHCVLLVCTFYTPHVHNLGFPAHAGRAHRSPADVCLADGHAQGAGDVREAQGRLREGALLEALPHLRGGAGVAWQRASRSSGASFRRSAKSVFRCSSAALRPDPLLSETPPDAPSFSLIAGHFRRPCACLERAAPARNPH